MSDEEARYQQGQAALLRLAVAAHDAVNKVIVPVDGDEFVTLAEDCPVLPGETVAGGERHVPAVEILRYLVTNWDEAHTEPPVELVDDDTWTDTSRPNWPREVAQQHLDADADHKVVPNDEPGEATNCIYEGCGLACTSDGERHGFDT